MTIQEVLDKIIHYHPTLGPRARQTCDGVKIGDPSVECTGIACAIYASPHVINQAIAHNCNLIVVHEPTFYDHMDPLDWIEDNTVAQAKIKLINDHGIVIFRDHDRIHSHRPDGIFYGFTKQMGWVDNLVSDPFALHDFNNKSEFPYVYHFEEGIPVKDIAKAFIEKLNLKGVRIIGNENTVVHNAVIAAHLFPGNQEVIAAFDKGGYDLMMPGEVCDWEVNEYFKDAAGLGMNKAMLNLGHFNWEELGMKDASGWLTDITDGALPVYYCHNDDMYTYVYPE